MLFYIILKFINIHLKFKFIKIPFKILIYKIIIFIKNTKFKNYQFLLKIQIIKIMKK